MAQIPLNSVLLPVSGSIDENLADLLEDSSKSFDVDGRSFNVENISAALAESIEVEENSEVPTNLDGLTDGFGQFSYSLSREMAVNLKLFAEASIQVNDSILMYQLAFYKDINDDDGYLESRYGAGVELALKISKLDSAAKLNHLPGIAAAVEYSHASVKYHMRTFGLAGNKIYKAIPSAGIVADFGIEAYKEVFSALDKIKDAVNDSSTTVTPRRMTLKIDVSYAESNYHEAMAILWALTQIRDGEKCRDAKKSCPVQSTLTKNTVQGIYEELAGRCSRRRKPNNIAQLKAQNILESFNYSNLLKEE